MVFAFSREKRKSRKFKNNVGDIKAMQRIYKLIDRKYLVAVVLAIFLISWISLSFIPKGKEEKKEWSIVNYTIEDAKAKYKGYNISLVTVANITYQTEEGKKPALRIVLKLTKWVSRYCVKRYHIQYIYPYRMFANTPPIPIVVDCQLCKKNKCSIEFEEAAVIASANIYERKFDSKIKEKIEETNASPEVKLIKKDGKKIWVVEWKKEDGETLFKIMLNDKGEIVEENETIKNESVISSG